MDDVVAALVGKYAVIGEIYELLGRLIHEKGVDKVLRVLSRQLFELVDLIFGFKRFGKQLVLIVILQASISVGRLSTSALSAFLQSFTNKGSALKSLAAKLNQAETYSNWIQIAGEIDRINGLDAWRVDNSSSLFDSRVLKRRIDDIKSLIEEGDVFTLLFRLRGGICRDQFGMQNERLFTKALSGPKLIVEQYHYTLCEALNFVCDTDDDGVPIEAKLAFFNETRHSYGRTALLLSGGAYLGYYHVGLVMSLLQQGMLPRVISGASAGSLIAAFVGTKLDQEFMSLAESGKFRKDFFSFAWHKKTSHPNSQWQYLLPQGLRWIGDAIAELVAASNHKSLLKLDTDHLKEVVIENVGHYTFQEAFDRTGRIINITVAPLNNYDPPRLLNYLTAPHVCVWSAAVASCAIPGVFESIELVVREPNGNFALENEWSNLKSSYTSKHQQKGNYNSKSMNNNNRAKDKETTEFRDAQRFSDGSVESDLPMQQLSELFNVNHFIVSQVNPHSFLFMTMGQQLTPHGTNAIFDLGSSCLFFLKETCKEWFRQFVNIVTLGTNLPAWGGKRGLTQALTQEYQGRDVDITISPWAKHLSVWSAFLSVIKNPTDEEFKEVVAASYRSTFPYIPRIRAQCSVEIVLDKCVQRLRRRISQDEDVQDTRLSNSTSNLADRAIDENKPAAFGSLNNLKKGRGRMPSFYTSRSLLNLSGLSVSDPPPSIVDEKRESATVSKLTSNPNSDNNLFGGDDDINLSSDQNSINNINNPNNVHNFYRSANSKHNSSNRLTGSRSSLSDYMVGKAVTSTGTISGKGFGSTGIDQTVAEVATMSELEAPTAATFHDIRAGIKKSTSMAKFYYQNAQSATHDL